MTQAEIRTRHFFIQQEERKATMPSTIEEQKKHNNNAAILMVGMSCLNAFMIDFETELKRANMFRHEVKHNFNKVSRMVERITNAFYSGAKNVKGGGFVRDYNEDVDNAMVAIDSAILIENPTERAYNIVVSLIRICLDMNNKIGRFKRDFVDELIPALNLLQQCQIKDYKIDFIVRTAIENI